MDENNVIKLNIQFRNMCDDRTVSVKCNTLSTFTTIVEFAVEKIYGKRSDFKLDNDVVIVFDQMNLELHGTPVGVGMVPNEKIYVIKGFKDAPESSTYAFEPRMKTEIEFGLNVLLGKDAPLPVFIGHDKRLPHDHSVPQVAQECQERLQCIKNALVPALEMTIDTYDQELPSFLPDISGIKQKLDEGIYEHGDTCLMDIENWLIRYRNSGIVMSNIQAGDEGRRRLWLGSDLMRTLKEFQQALKSYPRIPNPSSDRENEAFVEEKCASCDIYVGPVRNFEIGSQGTTQVPLPAVVFQVTNYATRFCELISSYAAALDVDLLDDVRLCLGNDDISLEASVHETIAEYVIKLNIQTIHIALHINYNSMTDDIISRSNVLNGSMTDTRDINELVSYIEGSGETKRKKKKTKKRKSRSLPSAATEPMEVESANNETNNAPSEERMTLQAEDENIEIEENGVTATPEQELPAIDSRIADVKRVIEKKTAAAEALLGDIQRIIDDHHPQLSACEKTILKEEARLDKLAKEKGKLEDKLGELHRQMEKIKQEIHTTESLRKNLDSEAKQSESRISKTMKERKILEHKLESILEPLKEQRHGLFEEVHSSKAVLTELEHEKEQQKEEKDLKTKDKKTEPHENPLVEFINQQILEKEKDLECPVCLEISEPPIYMCQDQHLICNLCWDKVRAQDYQCVLCRMPYPDQPKRHRYLEKVFEELAGLNMKKMSFINSK